MKTSTERMMDYPAGWTCERTVLHFEFYLLATLPLGEALAVAAHVEACVPCAQRLVLLGPLRERSERGR